MDLYTDITTNKLRQVSHPYCPKRHEDEEQNQLSVSDGLFHEEENPLHMAQFNELLASMSTKIMYSLMTQQEKQVAKAFWEACNYGGRPKPGDLKNMEDKRIYYEWVLRLAHLKQCDKFLKNVKIPIET